LSVLRVSPMTTSVPPSTTRWFRVPRSVALWLVCLTALAGVAVSTSEPRFYDDDPIAREPESQDASGAEPTDISLFYDLTFNLFAVTRRIPSDTRAGNVNTIDEVPDSSWFTNRVGAREVAIDELARGPNTGRPPNPSQWVLTREKAAGYAPGFTARDGDGETWFLSFDPPRNPEGATAAMVVATKLFWGLGYNQVETFLTMVDPKTLQIDPKASTRRPNGQRTPFTQDDLNEVLQRAARNADGTYRVAAARLLPGKILGGFRYEDTRPDDPNDIVPHEHRRELRALRVFGAWTNLTDLKAGNTLDTLVTSNGRGVVRHYLQDVGSTFGIGANGPHDWDEGWEYFYEGASSRRRLLSFGFARSPWQTIPYDIYPSVGRFEGERFDPTTWKPHTPTTAYMEMRADDAFWAARRVMAFTDDMIRAAVKAGQISDPQAERHLADVLIARRNRIGSAWLSGVTSLVNLQLAASGPLTFENAALGARGAEPPTAWRVSWSSFDNATGETRPIADTRSATTSVEAPPNLPGSIGSFIEVAVAAEGGAQAALPPLRAWFRRLATGWKLVGLERLPDRPSGAPAPHAARTETR
jgi:hypothetical protein